LADGLEFETNGMEGKLWNMFRKSYLTQLDPAVGWPPPDPDRIPRKLRRYGVQDEEDIMKDLEGFRKRQEEDLKRWNKADAADLRRRQPFHKRYDEQAIAANDTSSPNLYADVAEEGEESWKNGEGQGLKDFGLDEEAEFYDEDENVPLAELLRRKRAAGQG
jgi:palmitoyltransferase